MKIDKDILDQFKDDKAGLLESVRKMTPANILEQLASVQPIENVDLMAVADALEKYKWATPDCRMGIPLNNEEDK